MKFVAVALLVFIGFAVYFFIKFPSFEQHMQITHMMQKKPVPAPAAKPPVKKLSQKKDPHLITYSVEHASSSAVNTIPLKKAGMQVQVYYFGNPKGRIKVVTGDNQTFTIGKFRSVSGVGLEVLSLDNEDDYQARCRGYAPPGTTQLKLDCKVKNS